MTDTAESLRRKIDGAAELESVVRTMKALAAASITQYEQAVRALEDYDYTVALGLSACFRQQPFYADDTPLRGAIGAVVFGSDQGLVGQFNDILASFALEKLRALPGEKSLWTVGERLEGYLADQGMTLIAGFNVPNAIHAISALVGDVLTNLEPHLGKMTEVYVFHNRPHAGAGYEPVMQRLLPLDESWKARLAALPWPSKNLPEVLHCGEPTLRALVREYLFISLFRACAESLTSENTSRLAAMQRAEKNIDELLEELKQTFHQIRQSSIDEELFDVVAGYELFAKKSGK